MTNEEREQAHAEIQSSCDQLARKHLQLKFLFEKCQQELDDSITDEYLQTILDSQRTCIAVVDKVKAEWNRILQTTNDENN